MGHPNPVLYLIPGIGMVIVSIAAVVLWRHLSGCRFRWFWAGAGVWLGGVIPKIVFDALTHDSVSSALEGALPAALYPPVAAAWVGIQSSVFEIGVTLAAALLWKRMADRGSAATAVGLGAGAFEAGLLGVASLIGVMVIVVGLPGAEEGRAQLARTEAVTPAAWLLAPIERVLAISGHAGSRVLVLWSVANRRPLAAWAGFGLFALMDGVAGYVHVEPAMADTSMWWVELGLLPTAIAGGAAVWWCTRHWATEINGSARSSPFR
jgi:uncharacterized membrane protein YhfC